SETGRRRESRSRTTGRRVRTHRRKQRPSLAAGQRRRPALRSRRERSLRLLRRGNNEDQTMTKPLNIGMIGYGFMGRAHSNGYRKVNNFFDLEYRPVLKAVCARDQEKAKGFAEKWGYESIETDWRKVLARKDI